MKKRAAVHEYLHTDYSARVGELLLLGTHGGALCDRWEVVERVGASKVRVRRASVCQAERAGRAAFFAGRPRTPGLCPQTMRSVLGSKSEVEVEISLAIMAAWLRGWDAANLAS